jgi:polycomb protein EED
MRFKLHHVPNQNPVLAFCNAAGQMFFWDLTRINVYSKYMNALKDPDVDKSSLRLPSWLKPVIRRPKADTFSRVRGFGTDRESRASAQVAQTRQSGQFAQTDSAPQSPALHPTQREGSTKPKEEGQELSSETLESWASRYSTQNPQEPLRAHRTESSTANFVGRQAAWSPGGEWCVVVGSDNMTLILQRWADRAPARPTNGLKEG